MAPPKTVKQCRGFVSLCSYYRRFIPNFSEIANPLFENNKKYAKFKWTPECQKSFEVLKKCLMVTPLLGYPDSSKPFTLYTDSSDFCVGAVLTQMCDTGEEKPIHFLSHKLSKTQCNWSTVEKECFALNYALGKLNHYLQDASFVCKTDHQPLIYLLQSDFKNKKVARWALNIMQYNTSIEYLPGGKNVIADMLSRLPDPDSNDNLEVDEQTDEDEIPDISDKTFEINAINSNNFDPSRYARLADKVEQRQKTLADYQLNNFNLEQEQNKDQVIVDIKTRLRRGQDDKGMQNYIVIEKLLYFISKPDSDANLRLYIPEHLRHLVIKQFHDNNAHFGIDKTYAAIKSKYYWKNLFKNIYMYISKCLVCQKNAASRIRPPMQITDVSPFPMSKLQLDLSGQHPETISGNKYIVSFICTLTGWIEAFSVKSKEANNIVNLLINEIIPRHSCCLEIVTDNGSENVNKAVKETLETLNISHVKTSFYTPTANSRVERSHLTLNTILTKLVNDHTDTWDLYLTQALAAMRFNTNESTKHSPFFLMYGRDPVFPIDTLLKPRTKFVGEDFHKHILQNQHEAFTLVYKNIKKSKDRNIRYKNRNATEVTFEVNDPVFLRNHLRKTKLESKWKSYYRIIKKTSPVTFVVKNQLDGTTTTANVRHLKPANILEWNIPKPDETRRPTRKTAYVVPPSSTDGFSSDDESSDDNERETSSDDNRPLAQYLRNTDNNGKIRNSSSEDDNRPLAQYLRSTENSSNNRDSSSEDDNIPLAQYVRRKQVVKKRNSNKKNDESTQESTMTGPFESNSVEKIAIDKSCSVNDNGNGQGIESKALPSASRTSLIEKLMSQNEKFNADIISLLK